MFVKPIFNNKFTVKMRKLIIVFLVAMNCTITAQNNLKLDQKNGLRTLKFGDLKSKYEKKLVEHPWKKAYIFEYRPEDFNSLFNWTFSKMYLGFYDAKLGFIAIYWIDDSLLFKDILSKLEAIYGKSRNLSEFNNSDGLVSYNEWEGKNVIMSLRRSNYDPLNDCKNCTITLQIKNKMLEKQHLENEF